MGSDRPRSKTQRRWLGRIVGFLLVLGLSVTGWCVYRELQPERIRPRLEQALSTALNRDVTIGDLDLGWSTVELHEVRIANPPGFSSGPLMEVDRASFDVELKELLDRRLVGTVELSGVDLEVVKRGGRTNLQGMLGKSEKKEEPTGEIDIQVRVDDANVVLEDAERDERIAFRDVDLITHLTRREVEPKFDVSATIGRVELLDLALADIRTKLRINRPTISVQSFEADVVPSGRVTGKGRINLAQPKAPLWTFDLAVRDAELEGPIVELVSAGFPPMLLALATVEEEGAIEGIADVEAQLRGRGLQWPTIRPSLSGTVRLDLRDVALPAGTLLVQLGVLAGRKAESWTAKRASAELHIDKGWVQPETVRWGSDPVEIPVEGRVGLDGQLDLAIDIMPLVGRVEPKALDRLSSLPVRIGGTLQQPELGLPSVQDVGTDLLGSLLREGLTRTPSPESRTDDERSKPEPKEKARREPDEPKEKARRKSDEPKEKARRKPDDRDERQDKSQPKPEAKGRREEAR